MKKDELLEMSKKNNGYLFTSEVVNNGISKPYFATFLKKKQFEKVAHGIFAAPDTWPDELFILQKTSPKVVFSGETALYLNGMMEREYQRVHVNVPKGYNSSHLRKRGIAVKSVPMDLYEVGQTQMESPFGNLVTAYDKERCICDAIINRKNMDVQIFQTAMKEYMTDTDRNIPKLVQYAQKLGIRDEVMKYVEVMV